MAARRVRRFVRPEAAVPANPNNAWAEGAERITSYTYDPFGRLQSVVEDLTPANEADATLDTEYRYTLAGSLGRTVLPNGTHESYVYDALGRLDVMSNTFVVEGSGEELLLTRYDYTVRADGKRTKLVEEFWFDGSAGNPQDGIRQPGELKETSYDWTYDNIGRLTREEIAHFDSAISQTEHFEYDLTGNRTKLTKDASNDLIIDEVITYDYDASDRLLFEWLDSDVDGTADQTTEYEYDQTQQTEKSVYGGFVDEDTAAGSYPATLSRQLFRYNLQGRMSGVINEQYSAGTITSRTRTWYEYDSKSYRIALVNEGDTTPAVGADLWTADAVRWSSESSTEYLADHRNFTGYAQTVRETTVNADGTRIIVDYTFGHDEISQTVSKFNADGSPNVSPTTHAFGHDGHGSVRVLYDLAEAAGRIAQAFTYAAYGELLALHGSDGVAAPATAAFTSLGNSGEHFDAKAQQQYLRARWYDPANGRFNRLDPFAGNMQDPQSLHKYAYVHGDPIQGFDPTGLFGLSTTLSGMSMRGGLIGAGIGAGAGYAYAVHSTGEWFSVVHIKYALIGGLAGFAIGATAGAYVGYAANAARGLSSGGALHNFVKVGEKLWVVPRAMRSGTLGAAKGKIFASFAIGAAAGAWAAAVEDDPYSIGIYGGTAATALATETAMSVAYHRYISNLIRASGSTKLMGWAIRGSGTADIAISFTVGFHVGYGLSKGAQITTDQIIRALEE